MVILPEKFCSIFHLVASKEAAILLVVLRMDLVSDLPTVAPLLLLQHQDELKTVRALCGRAISGKNI